MNDVHVLPVDDLIEHDETEDLCICGPTVTLEPGGRMVVHHSLDGREHATVLSGTMDHAGYKLHMAVRHLWAAIKDELRRLINWIAGNS